MTKAFITIVKCWDNPQATKDTSKRTRLLVDYLYTDKKAAQLDLTTAIDRFPNFGWSIDYRVADNCSQIKF